jgi:Tfp pilus assembly protein PilF
MFVTASSLEHITKPMKQYTGTLCVLLLLVVYGCASVRSQLNGASMSPDQRNHAYSISGHGLILARHGKLTEAVDALHEAVRLDPTSASTHNYLADALLKQGKMDEADAEYGEARRLSLGAASPQ